MEIPELFHNAYYRGGNGGGLIAEKQVVEQFLVEDLLDFPNDVDEEDEVNGLVDGTGDEVAGGNSCESSSIVTAVYSCKSSFSGNFKNHFSEDLACRSLAAPALSGDICEPYDQLAELEWLSNFVEDSYSSDGLPKLQLVSSIKPSPSSSSSGSHGAVSITTSADVVEETLEPASAVFLPETAVPGKTRSKRSRAAPCNWSSRLLALSPTPATSSSESYPEAATTLVPPAKRVSKPKKGDLSEGPNYAASDGRKCLHCATDKTPQWRTGPMGPKTLCNACGVRFKSGRLVPEYRPAASPTFILSKHSNSHRKVLELRRQKELFEKQEQFMKTCGVGFDGSAADDVLIDRIGSDYRQY